MWHQARTAIALFIMMTLLTGVVYPLLITGLTAVLFPYQSGGSIIMKGEKKTASQLIGQEFNSPRYFWGRPSATTPAGYNAASSTGSNLGPSNPDLKKSISVRLAALRSADPDNRMPVPADLVTASASGLDPHISPAAAAWQAPRIARQRGLALDRVQSLIEKHTEGRQFGVLGEARVNVLQLNLALDAIRR